MRPRYAGSQKGWRRGNKILTNPGILYYNYHCMNFKSKGHDGDSRDFQTSQRAGEGVSPVQVAGHRISLQSLSPQHKSDLLKLFMSTQ